MVFLLLQVPLSMSQNFSDFEFNVKYRQQFVAALKDAELSCTAISDTDMIIPPQAAANTKAAFVVLLKDAKLSCTVVLYTGTYHI
jgi:hypothetical protein